MKDFLKSSQLPSFLRKLLPYVALLFFLGLTIAIWRHWSNSNAEKEQRRFAHATIQVAHDLSDRLHQYGMVLQGGGGVFAASETVTRKAWHAYVEYRNIAQLFPGIQGVGFSKVIRPSELKRHTREIRAEGFPGYAVRPTGEREVYTSIVFLEPLDWRNQRAFGYDMFSEPVRRSAMERARDTGAASVSGKVQLVQETAKEVQAGFLMYLPIYRKGRPLHTLEERRTALQGYVYSPFRMADLMKGIFPVPNREVRFKIYDGTEVSEEGLLYDSESSNPAAEKRRPMFSGEKTLDLLGRPWTLTFSSRPAFETAVDQYTAKGILAGGILVSLLIFFVLYQQERLRGRALVLAKGMTAAFQESEQRYKTLNDTLPVGVSIIGPNMEILVSNKIKHQWFPGGRYDEHPYCYMVYNMPPRTTPCEGCPVIQAFQDGQPHRAERKAETTLGSRILSLLAVPLTDQEGRITSVHETVEDITEHKQLEVEQIARRAAEEANRVKSDFLANMSHELRTPLNSIIGFSEVLLDQYFGNLTEKQSVYVNNIHHSGSHLLSLINDILDLAKIESGKMALDASRFPLRPLLESSLVMLREKALSHGIHLSIEIEPKADREIEADERKLRQIVFNLLSNAVKFTPDGGSVRMSARFILDLGLRLAELKDKLGIEGFESAIEISVADTGIGIKEADRAKLFQEFVQIESAYTKHFQGTGLGLALTKRMVELHGGRIWVESEGEGKGSKFTFVIPIERLKG